MGDNKLLISKTKHLIVSPFLTWVEMYWLDHVNHIWKQKQLQCKKQYLVRIFHKINLQKKLHLTHGKSVCLTLSRRRPLSYRKQSIDLRIKSMGWFLYGNGLRHERVKLTTLFFRVSELNLPNSRLFNSLWNM